MHCQYRHMYSRTVNRESDDCDCDSEGRTRMPLVGTSPMFSSRRHKDDLVHSGLDGVSRVADGG